MRDALQFCLRELYDRTLGILGGEKPLAAAISPGRAMEDFSGKNQDATFLDRFAPAPVYCLHGGSLSPTSDATADASSFCWFLYAVYGTGWLVPWRQNADIDMDERDRAHQARRRGHDHIVWRLRIYRAAVRGIYAPARMDAGLLRIYELLCGCKSFLIRLGLSVAAEKRCCPFFGSLMEKQ